MALAQSLSNKQLISVCIHQYFSFPSSTCNIWSIPGKHPRASPVYLIHERSTQSNPLEQDSYILLMILNVLDILNHLMMNSPFKMTCIIWLSGVLHLMYFSIPPKVPMYRSIKKFLHYITSEVILMTLLIVTMILEL